MLASCGRPGSPTQPSAASPSCSRSSAAATEAPSVASGAFWRDAAVWRRAGANTTRCLIGCSLGDLSSLYMLNALCPQLGMTATVAASCAAGISTSMALETVVLRATEGMSLRRAWSTAAGMSLISMVSMELAENAVELALTGGSMSGPAFWQALPPALAAGFLTPLPYVREPSGTLSALTATSSRGSRSAASRLDIGWCADPPAV